MKTVKVIDWMPNKVVDVVKELKEQGYVLGVDFDFEYNKPKYNDWSGDAVYNRHTVFTFYKEELATYFMLRYS